MDRIRIAVAQVPQTADIETNLAKALEFMDKAAKKDVELLCFPETHLPGYRVGVLEPDDPCQEHTLEHSLGVVRERARELGMGIIMGTETHNPDGKPFNTAVVIGTAGEIVARHHKSRLTPGDAKGYADPGENETVFTFRDVTMGLVICFEGYRFPELTRGLAKKGARVVFHPQFNHVMRSMQWKLPVQESLIVSRAAENTLWFISANMCHPCNNCRSMVVAPSGLVRTASVLTRETLLVCDIDPNEATHAFLSTDTERMAKALGEA